MGASILTFVGTGVLEQNNFALFEVQASLLGKEEVGTLDDVFEVGFSFSIDERCDVRDIDSFRSNNEMSMERARPWLYSRTDHHMAQRGQP